MLNQMQSGPVIGRTPSVSVRQWQGIEEELTSFSGLIYIVRLETLIKQMHIPEAEFRAFPKQVHPVITAIEPNRLVSFPPDILHSSHGRGRGIRVVLLEPSA